MTSQQHGQALLEFALVLPILLLLVLGIVSFGLYINADVTIQQAARIGARAASIGATLGCPGDSAKAQIQSGSSATVYGVVDDQINQGVGLSTGSGSSAKQVLTPTPTIVTNPNGTAGANSIVTVTVAMTYNPIVPIPGLLPPSMTIKQAYSMLVEDPQPSNATRPTDESANTVKMVSTTTCP
ncbi:pilus assembly protein [Alicyclobacillus sp. ALC3]|nr:pilus assembly protein [Alicyclobacillus sp. ALC3]